VQSERAHSNLLAALASQRSCRGSLQNSDSGVVDQKINRQTATLNIGDDRVDRSR
jgi:hypothetical protein